MPFIQPTQEHWIRTVRRKLVMGMPNSGKTTSIRTAKRPVHVISYPGELGTNSIPREEGIHSYVWEASVEDKQDSKAVLQQVHQLTVDILTGKYGACETFIGDGLHKLGYYFLDAAGGGTYFKGKDFDVKREFGILDPYTKSYAGFETYMKMVMESSVPNVIFTCWDGKETESYAGVKVEGGRVYPGLHGQLAKRVMGMFSFVLYAEKYYKVGSKVAEYQWRLKETKEVAGAAMKLAPELAAKLPETVEQNWEKLDDLLMKLVGQQKVA